MRRHQLALLLTVFAALTGTPALEAGTGTGTIRGRVVDAVTGEPLPFLRFYVITPGGDFVTDVESRSPDGELVVDLAPGAYLVYTFGDFYRHLGELWPEVLCTFPVLGGCDFSRGAPIEVFAGAVVDGIDFTLDPGARITGQVHEGASGGRISRLDVGLWNDRGELISALETSGRGIYEHGGLPTGRYFVGTLAGKLDPWVDEVWDDVACGAGAAAEECAPQLVGTPIDVVVNERRPGVDFVLHRRPGTREVALGADRFLVTARWQTRDGRTGEARGLALTADSGYFWFFGPGNVELLVKVLDACAEHDHFWVFAAGLTDVGVELTVFDRVSGQSKTYRHAPGTPYLPIRDTRAFATCPPADQPVENPQSRALLVPPQAAGARACRSNGMTLCLNQWRFRVRATWETAAATGNARALFLTGDTGSFRFFHPDNVELVVKVLDACHLPAASFWVIAAGLTDVGVRLEVTDTLSGEVRTWESPRGEAFAPILDTRAFATCGAAP